MITEDDVREVVSRYPNLELQISKTFLRNQTKRLLVYVNSKLFSYGSNLLIEYDYCGVPKDGILQVNNGNQHIYSDWAYTPYKDNVIYLVENVKMKKKVRNKEQFEQLIVNSLKMLKEVEVKLKLAKIRKDFV